jgi:hypothetical protein
MSEIGPIRENSWNKTHHCSPIHRHRDSKMLLLIVKMELVLSRVTTLTWSNSISTCLHILYSFLVLKHWDSCLLRKCVC